MHINREMKIILLLVTALFIKSGTEAQPVSLPPYIATDIKTERIKFSNESVKITWKMDKNYSGDFILGRSEKEISSIDDALQAKLIGIYNSSMNGIHIDLDIQQGKKYYYIILAKDYLLKRNIDIIRNSNYTPDPFSLYAEPDPVESIKVNVSETTKILIRWNKSRGSSIRYNLYRSRSSISSPGELEVAEKISTTDKNEFTDSSVPDYGSYFYAVTITDKNGIEYFNPKKDQNYTSTGIYLKGKSFASPLNVEAFNGDKHSIIVKWEKSESRTGKELQGYEIYRSDEIINTLLKLKFSKLIRIVDTSTIIYTDKDLNPGKYYYAVFSRYSDGTVDINFDTDSNYTKTPLMITQPYKIVSVKHEIVDKKTVIKWNYSGNTGNEIVTVFKSIKIPANSAVIPNEDIIGTENVKAEKFTIETPSQGSFYYGILCRNDNETIKIAKGINITAKPVESGSGVISEKEYKKNKPSDAKNLFKEEDLNFEGSDLDYIIYNTYYKGKFSLALKELKNYMSTTDNKYDQSKAKLFIAKTYIEMHEYQKSINLLEDNDVKTAFPDESKFWTEFAIVRLK